MGPMAEDFYEAFELGTDPEHISNVDADGVALAAIQGLSERLEDARETLADRDARIDDLEAENEELRARNDALDARLAAIEERLGIENPAGQPTPAED